MVKKVNQVPKKYNSNEVSRRVRVFYCEKGREGFYNADNVVVILRQKDNKTTMEFKIPEMKAWQLSRFMRNLEIEVTKYET